VLLVGHLSVLDVAGDILTYVTDVVFKGKPFDLGHYRELIGRLQATARADVAGLDSLTHGAMPFR
jgi:hypothetical protein